jgi:hypothetical protein
VLADIQINHGDRALLARHLRSYHPGAKRFAVSAFLACTGDNDISFIAHRPELH